MNAKKFSDAMSELDTKYVDEALNYKTKMKKPIWIKWGIMAACLCLIICVVTIPRLLNGSNPPISGDLAPMVYVNNKLYQYTDSQLDFTDKESQFTYLGEIESKVSSSQEPKENFQANDDIVGAKVYQYENNIVVLIDGKYFLYSHMEDAENETVEFEGQLKEKGWLSGIMQNEAMMSAEERLIYETFGGRDTIIKNLMKQFDSDGDLLNANGVAGMDVTGKGTSWQQLTSVSEEYRQKMFDNVKREFIKENGISNGDTTKRSDIFKDYQLSVSKDKRLSGTWTLEQYEGQYRAAMYAAVKSANPNWKPGQKFDTSILDNVTRESVESTLVKNGNRLVRNSIDVSV